MSKLFLEKHQIMEEILKQIKLGLDHNLYLLSLYSALTLPDICGAIDSADGEASGKKYREWYEKYIGPNYHHIDSIECYNLRCKVLHQGKTESKKASDYYSFIAFAEPVPKEQGKISINIGKSEIDGIAGPKSIDVIEFILAIVAGVEEWMSVSNGSEPYNTNVSKIINRHPEGLPNLIQGVSYIY